MSRTQWQKLLDMLGPGWNVMDFVHVKEHPTKGDITIAVCSNYARERCYWTAYGDDDAEWETFDW